MPVEVISHTCSVTLCKASVTLRKASVCVTWLHAGEPRPSLLNACYTVQMSLLPKSDSLWHTETALLMHADILLKGLI